jgi:hypothetical protein
MISKKRKEPNSICNHLPFDKFRDYGAQRAVKKKNTRSLRHIRKNKIERGRKRQRTKVVSIRGI